MSCNCFFSNNLYALASALFTSIDSKQCLYNKVTVLVPNLDLKEFFHTYLTEHKDLKVSMFLKVATLEEGLYSFKRKGFGSTVNFQSLRLLILSMIKKGFYFSKVCKSKAQMQALSKRLSSLFMRYRLLSRSDLDEWIAMGGEAQEIFTKTLEVFPLLECSDFVFASDHDVHFFGFDALASIYQDLIFQEKNKSIYFYFQSASSLFWADILSSRAQYHLVKKFEKQNIGQEQIDVFENLTGQTNPILANFSKLAQPLYSRLLDYREHAQVYVEDFGSSDLDQLRKSIYEQSFEKIQAKVDGTFEVLSAASKLREVQELYDNLQAAFASEKIEQRQVSIFALDIGQYLAQIQEVFCKKESLFHVHVKGLKNTVNNLWMQTLSNFLEFLGSAFSFRLMNRFLFSPDFRISNISEKEQRLFERYFLSASSFEKVEESLFESLAFKQDIALEEAESLGHLMQAIQVLRAIHAKVSKMVTSVGQWSCFFIELVQEHFASGQQEQQILDAMLELSELDEQHDLDFGCIIDIFDDLLHKKVGSFQSHSGYSLVFANLSLNAITPKKRIYCLGLDEQSFVRHESMDVLAEPDMLKKTGVASQNMEDRACILKMILNASDALWFSFTNMSPTDAKKINESLILRECLDFLNLKVKSAPLLSFDSSYFQKESYKAPSDFSLAQMFYKTCTFKVPEKSPESVCDESFTRIDIDDLTHLLTNPLRFFAKKRLGLALKNYDKDPLEAKEFFLSYAMTKVLVDRSLSQGVQKTFDEVKEEYQLEAGPWLDVAKKTVERKVQELKLAFSRLGIKEKDLFVQHVRLDSGGKNKVHIFGKLDLLTPQGIVAHEKNKMQAVFKNWAKIVVLNCLDERVCSVDRALCVSGIGKKLDFKIDQPAQALESLINYYKKACLSPSLLKAENVAQAIKKAPLQGGVKPFFQDPYFDLLEKQQKEFSKEVQELCKHINV